MLENESSSTITSGRGTSRPVVFFLAALGPAVCVLSALTSQLYAAQLHSTPDLTQVFALTKYSDGRKFLVPQVVYVDPRRGDVYVADTGSGRIVVLDQVGQLVASFNHRSSPDTAAEPIGVAVDAAGQIFVTDRSGNDIHVYDFRGRPTGKIVPGEQDRDALFGRMALDNSGNLYVIVRNKGQVFVFDPDGRLKSKIGETDDANARIEMAADVAVDTEGRIYILSSRGTAVHVFSPSGVAMLRFGEHANGPQNFAFPTAIDVDAQGRIWVIDSFAHCIKVFTNSGSHITTIGGYIFPVDLAIRHDQNQLFVLEKSAQRLSGYTIGEGGLVN